MSISLCSIDMAHKSPDLIGEVDVIAHAAVSGWLIFLSVMWLTSKLMDKTGRF